MRTTTAKGGMISELQKQLAAAGIGSDVPNEKLKRAVIVRADPGSTKMEPQPGVDDSEAMVRHFFLLKHTLW